MASMSQKIQEETPKITKSNERNAFILLAVFLAPIIMVMAVAGYGFLIWMSQIVFGPPTV